MIEQVTRNENGEAKASIDHSITNHLTLYCSAQRKAVAFLLAHVNQDGSIGDAAMDACYYRVPWAFAVAGEPAAAMRMLAWIRKHMLTADGELAGSISAGNNWRRPANTYTETCLAYGAQLLRQYDIAQRVMRFALRSQNPATGGVYVDRQRCTPDGPQLLFLTAQLGMSALFTGRLPEARAAGERLRRVWEAQPELPNRLYTGYRGAGWQRPCLRGRIGATTSTRARRSMSTTTTGALPLLCWPTCT